MNLVIILCCFCFNNREAQPNTFFKTECRLQIARIVAPLSILSSGSNTTPSPVPPHWSMLGPPEAWRVPTSSRTDHIKQGNNATSFTDSAELNFKTIEQSSYLQFTGNQRTRSLPHKPHYVAYDAVWK